MLFWFYMDVHYTGAVDLIFILLRGSRQLFDLPYVKIKQEAWNVALGWNQAEPSNHHLAMPFQIASYEVFAVYGAGIILAFGSRCFLRPGEFLNALRKQLMLPMDVGRTVDLGIFSIMEPKTR